MTTVYENGAIDAEDANYVCTLDAVSQKKATEELNEDPRERMGAVKALRDWIKTQSHMKVPHDTSSLLQILRTRKYSQLESRKMIQNMLRTVRSVPEWFMNIDPGDPTILTAIDAGVMVPLPGRDDQGRKIVISRRGYTGPTELSADAIVRATGVVFMYLNQDELTQVNGMLHINDFTDFSLKQQTGWKFEKLIKSTQGTFPGRYKGMHFYNGGKFMDFFIGLFKTFAPKKYAERITSHSSLETLYDHIPKHMLPLEYLPDDYTGPNAGSIKDLIDDIKTKLTEEKFRQKIIERSHEGYYLDESKLPKDEAPVASFRKLNVD